MTSAPLLNNVIVLSGHHQLLLGGVRVRGGGHTGLDAPQTVINYKGPVCRRPLVCLVVTGLPLWLK